MVCPKPRGVSTEASPASGEDPDGTSRQMDSRVMKKDLCPQCGIEFDTTNFRKLTQTCGHILCRRCIIQSEEGCPQCKPAQAEKVDILKAKKSQEDAGPSKPPQTQARRAASSSRLQSASSEATSSWESPTGDIPLYHDTVEKPDQDSDSRSSRRSVDVPEEVPRVPVRTSLRLKAKRSSSSMAAPTPPPASTSNSLAVAKRTPKPKKKDQGIPAEEKRDDDDEAERCKDPVPKKKRSRSTFIIPDHIMIFGTDPPIYKCNPCNNKFFYKGHCRYHAFCLSDEKPFNCGQCGQGFSVKIRYEHHLKQHAGGWPHVCSICDKGFFHLSNLTRHMRTHTNERPFKCQECHRAYATAGALRSHTIIHTGEKAFACGHCDKQFLRMKSLKSHLKTHAGERSFSNHCDQSFATKSMLDAHLRCHTQELTYSCAHCTWTFSNKKDLRRHLVTHSGENPFQCLICERAFRRKDNLNRHIVGVHCQPKELSEMLANEAAINYLKKTTGLQSLEDILKTKVNAVVTTSVLENANLLPPGGIVPRTPSNSREKGVPSRPRSLKSRVEGNEIRKKKTAKARLPSSSAPSQKCIIPIAPKSLGATHQSPEAYRQSQESKPELEVLLVIDKKKGSNKARSTQFEGMPSLVLVTPKVEALENVGSEQDSVESDGGNHVETVVIDLDDEEDGREKEDDDVAIIAEITRGDP